MLNYLLIAEKSLAYFMVFQEMQNRDDFDKFKESGLLHEVKINSEEHYPAYDIKKMLDDNYALYLVGDLHLYKSLVGGNS